MSDENDSRSDVVLGALDDGLESEGNNPVGAYVRTRISQTRFVRFREQTFFEYKELYASDIKILYRMNRRQALSTLALAGSVSFAGCSSVLDSEGIVLGKIEVFNSSFVENRIRLMVQRDGEVLLDRKITLPGIDAENGTPATIIQPLWSDKKGAYTVTAIHYNASGNRESGKYEYTFTRKDYDAYYGDDHEGPGCLGAVVKIGSLSDTENPEIGIGPMDMDTPCGTPNSQ